jgi:hypothetical protein
MQNFVPVERQNWNYNSIQTIKKPFKKDVEEPSF